MYSELTRKRVWATQHRGNAVLQCYTLRELLRTCGQLVRILCGKADEGIGYIDLSKRRVSPEDIVKCEERYNKGKMVHSIMRHVAEKANHPIEDLYEKIGWPLNKKYGHAVDAFKLSIT